MVQLIPPPEPHTLLPPFLACLPTAFASTQPPPALLPLLSPILRQRVQLLAPNSTSQSESWLKLLCWSPQQADKMQAAVEAGTWEPHPASGEIEVDNVGELRYKRFDEETLRAQIPLPDYNLTALYLWCESNEEGSGWRVAELLPFGTEIETDRTWSKSIAEANSLSSDQILNEALRDAERAHNGHQASFADHDAGQEDDDDDYWAQYDQTPGRTPATKRSPAPQSLTGHGPTEDDYYAQYSNVEPVIDATDSPSPSQSPPATNTTISPPFNDPPPNPYSHLLARQPATEPSPPQSDTPSYPLSHPKPSRSPSASTTGSDTVARLEQSAASRSDSEVAIRQHISTSVKSMYRLARGVGMEKEEFRRILEREMEVLDLLD